MYERDGQAWESMFTEQLDDHLVELAHHFSWSDNVVKAVEYLGVRELGAAQQIAHSDAVGHSTSSL